MRRQRQANNRQSHTLIGNQWHIARRRSKVNFYEARYNPGLPHINYRKQAHSMMKLLVVMRMKLVKHSDTLLAHCKRLLRSECWLPSTPAATPVYLRRQVTANQ